MVDPTERAVCNRNDLVVEQETKQIALCVLGIDLDLIASRLDIGRGVFIVTGVGRKIDDLQKLE